MRVKELNCVYTGMRMTFRLPKKPNFLWRFISPVSKVFTLKRIIAFDFI